MKEITGDLLLLAKQGQFDVIVHGCNCFCIMGAGIAKAIKLEFPEAYTADLNTVPGNLEKLGEYSKAYIIRHNKEFIVVNAYIQFNWRGQGVKANYEAIRKVFSKIKVDFPNARIAYPLCSGQVNLATI